MADTVISPATAGAGPGAQSERIVGFWGRRGALFGILMMNTLLGVLTLGVYRFWARTRLRQYFWNSIEIDGDLLEYTGRGLELFIGFLIVVAVLVPLAIGYQLLSVFLQANAPDVFTAVNFLYFITLFWLARYAYFRARRYRLARTVWRGICAGQDGSAAGYAWLWFGYAILSVITLGWAVPWMTAELQKYEVEHARFGVENFRYEGTGTGLLRAWAPCAALWSLAFVAALGMAITNFSELQMMFLLAELRVENAEFPLDITEVERLLSMYAIMIITLLISIPFYVVYRIKAFRYMFRVSNLSGVGFDAEFGGWRLAGYWFLYVVVVVGLILAVVLMLFGAIGGLAVIAETGEFLEEDLVGVGIALSIIPMVLLIFVMPMLNLLLFYYPSIRHIATTLRLTEISSLERIVQSSKDDPRFGEGLAAALDFDVGGF